jgi:hypothetical protein
MVRSPAQAWQMDADATQVRAGEGCDI